MQLNDTLRSIFRRWYIVLLGLIVSAGLAGAAVVLIPPTYEAEGTLLLMPPSKIVGSQGNPYLYLGGMNGAVDVLVRRANAPDVVEAIEKLHSGVKIVYSAAPATSSPIVAISITGGDKESVIGTLEAGRTILIRKLEAMQSELKVPQPMRITAETLVIGHEATANRKTAIQFAILVAAAGTVGTLMFTGFIDGLLLARTGIKSIDRTRGSKRKTYELSTPDELDFRDAALTVSAVSPLEAALEPSLSRAESLK